MVVTTSKTFANLALLCAIVSGLLVFKSIRLKTTEKGYRLQVVNSERISQSDLIAETERSAFLDKHTREITEYDDDNNDYMVRYYKRLANQTLVLNPAIDDLEDLDVELRAKNESSSIKYKFFERYMRNIDAGRKTGSLVEQLNENDFTDIQYDETTTDQFGVPLYLVNTWNPRRLRSKAEPKTERGRLAMRKLIMKNQNPSDCNKKKLCTCPHAKGLGLFSMLHGRVACLLAAITEDCTLVSTRTGSLSSYYNYNTCSSYKEKWDCYFEPIHSCPDNVIDHRRKHELRRGTYEQSCGQARVIMRKILDRVGLESEMIAQSEAVAWVMRPNKRLKESVSLWARYLNIGKTDQVDGTMSVHIRHGDKPSVDHSEKKFSTFTSLMLYLRQIYGIGRAHVMSDDGYIGLQLTELHKFLSVFAMPKEAYPGSKLLSKKVAQKEQMQLLLKKAGTSKSQGDEALALFTETILMSRSKVFIGAITSNIAQTIVELMATMNFPPNYHDRYGDMYSFCWFGESHMNFRKLAHGFRHHFPFNGSHDPLSVPMNLTRIECLHKESDC